MIHDMPSYFRKTPLHIAGQNSNLSELLIQETNLGKALLHEADQNGVVPLKDTVQNRNCSMTTTSKMINYADDSTVYAKAKTIESLVTKLERIGNIMIHYCNENNLIINSQKTQILTSAKQEIKVKIGQNIVTSNQTISLLGLEYDENFSTAPYLRNLSRDAST